MRLRGDLARSALLIPRERGNGCSANAHTLPTYCAAKPIENYSTYSTSANGKVGQDYEYH